MLSICSPPYGVIRRRPIEIPAMLLGEGARKAEKQQNEKTDSAAHSCCGCSDRRLSVLAVIYMALFVTSTFAQMARLRIFAPGALLAVVCRGARSSQGMKENQRYLTCSELRTGRLGPIRQDPDRSPRATPAVRSEHEPLATRACRHLIYPGKPALRGWFCRR